MRKSCFIWSWHFRHFFWPTFMMDLESGQCHYMLTTGMALMSVGASINYVVYGDYWPPPSPFVVFLLSKFGDPPPPHPLPRRHSLWTAPCPGTVQRESLCVIQRACWVLHKKSLLRVQNPLWISIAILFTVNEKITTMSKNVNFTSDQNHPRF